MNIKVYRYGLLAPHENDALVREQMRLAHRYRNTLVQIERTRRAALRTLASSYPSVDELEVAARLADTAVGDAVRAAKAAKAATKKMAPAGLREAVVAARAEKRRIVGELREARAKLRLILVDEQNAINKTAADQRRTARATCGAYWGSYLGIEDADQAARQQPLYDGHEPNDPRFVSWRGEGTVGVQLQGGLSLDKLTTDTQLRIEPWQLPKGADPASRRSALRQRVVLAMRVQSDESKKPIWARWKCIMHRPIPPGAIIKWAKVSLRKIGPREEWSVAITVDLSATAAAPGRATSDAAPGAPVAIDLGWRQLSEEPWSYRRSNGETAHERGNPVRVAAWFDGANEGTLVLSPQVVAQARKADDLRSIRDRNFDAARAALVAALGRITSDAHALLPPWLTEAAATLHQWKSQARLAALALRWKGERFGGDVEAYDALEAWRYHDYHLWEWECSQRKKAHRHRREVYRMFAADLAKRYGRLVLEVFDLSEVARHETVESGVAEIKGARSMRQLIAPSELRLVLLNAFGGRWEKVPAPGTTFICNPCGSEETWDQAKELSHTCSACGVTWDQDDNAAKNILARASAGGTGGSDGSARGAGDGSDSAAMAESRWVRAKRMKAEKDAAKGTAREAVREAAE